MIDPELHGEERRLGAVLEFEFREDVAHVPLHGAFRELQRLADGPVALALREQLEDGMGRALRGEFEVMSMPALEMELSGGRGVAFNDVSFIRLTHGRVAELSYSVGGQEVGHVRCDGLVAATPAGSTGYNLANAGPILAWGVEGYVVSFIAPHTLTARSLVVAPGDVWVRGDFGYALPGGSTIGDEIYLDLDADGLRDANEPGIAGVTVVLRNSGGNVIASTITDGNGNYSFPGLPDGTYSVTVTDTAGILADTPTNTGDPDGGFDRTSTVTLAGGDNLSQDFGFVPAGHSAGEGLIADTIFLDRDGSGTPDAGEGIQPAAPDDANQAGAPDGRETRPEPFEHAFGSVTHPAEAPRAEPPDSDAPSDDDGQ